MCILQARPVMVKSCGLVRTVDHNEVVKGIGGAVPLESVE